jgi:hypothetical protein
MAENELAVFITSLGPALAAAYFCLLAPGQAWWRPRNSALPRLLAQVALSTAWTGIAATTLTAASAFSLPRLVLLNASVSLAGYLWVGRTANPQAPASRSGLAVALLALLLYWPPFETHIAASDSSTYLAAATNLARSHSLSKVDPLLEEIPSTVARRHIFPSALGLPWKPPYSRMPGGLVMDSLDANEVRPAFFPLPIVWSAIFADALGSRYAGGQAPLFAALALWATYAFTRKRMGTSAALLVTALMGINAASYWAGRFALAEPAVWFFLWAGLLGMDAWEEEGLAADSAFAAAMFSMAAFSRPEFSIFIGLALLCRRLLRSSVSLRPLHPVFFVTMAAGLAAVAAEVYLLPGAYTAPITDTLSGLSFRLTTLGLAPKVTAVAMALVFLALALRRFGLKTTAAAAIVFPALAVYAASSHFLLPRSLAWLGAYLGWPTLVLATIGALWCWRKRHERPADAFFLVLAFIISALVLYDPHVYPSLPWASRRFVPMVVPLSLVLAAMATTRLASRHLVAGLAAWGILIASVVMPARASWSTPFYQGSYDQLADFNAAVPANATLLIDGRLDTLVLGPALWLTHGRESLPVHAAYERGRNVIASLAFNLPAHRDLWLLKPTLNEDKKPPWVSLKHMDDFIFQLLLPEQSTVGPPQRAELYTLPVSLFRLRSTLRHKPGG